MMQKLRKYWSLATAEMGRRASVVKIKINGQCVNKCSFCMFHDDPRKLEVEHLARLFDMMERPRYRRIDINGGEPTLHPRFIEISGYLKEQSQGRILLYLGSNLIPLAKPSRRAARFRQAALDTYDVISVGCDDEHHNIDCLEQLGPEIVESGHLLFVNVMEDFCSPETRRRVVALRDRIGMRVTFSKVHHYYEERPLINDVSVPCNRRTKELLVNCDGNTYFCFHQEFEEPLCNLHTVSPERLNYVLNEYDPPPYRFCASCPCYKPERTQLWRRRLHLPVAAPAARG